jgi:hypothetical protein
VRLGIITTFLRKRRLGMVVHACNPIYLGGRSMRIVSSRPGKVSKTLFQKQNMKERARGVAPGLCNIQQRSVQNPLPEPSD